MTPYRLVAEPRADLDVAAAYQWCENEQAGLGLEFLNQLKIASDRIADDPFRYQELQSGIRRVLIRAKTLLKISGSRPGGRGSPRS